MSSIQTKSYQFIHFIRPRQHQHDQLLWLPTHTSMQHWRGLVFLMQQQWKLLILKALTVWKSWKFWKTRVWNPSARLWGRWAPQVVSTYPCEQRLTWSWPVTTLKYQERTSRIPDPDLITLDGIRALRAFKHWELDHKDVTAPTIHLKGWPKTIQGLVEYLTGCLGFTKIPLAYVVREDLHVVSDSPGGYATRQSSLPEHLSFCLLGLLRLTLKPFWITGQKLGNSFLHLQETLSVGAMLVQLKSQ